MHFGKDTAVSVLTESFASSLFNQKTFSYECKYGQAPSTQHMGVRYLYPKIKTSYEGRMDEQCYSFSNDPDDADSDLLRYTFFLSMAIVFQQATKDKVTKTISGMEADCTVFKLLPLLINNIEAIVFW